MRAGRLQLSNFRNIYQSTAEFAPGATALLGDNGQGKTNTLEAVTLALCGSSHRQSKLRHLIGDAGDTASIFLTCTTGDGREHEITLAINASRKIHRMNGTYIKNRAELAELFPVILFEPDDLRLIKDGPANRREWMDNALSILSRSYAVAFGDYRKIHAQKSSLLKSRAPSWDLLSIYNDQLALLGSRLTAARIKFLAQINPNVRDMYASLSQREEIAISYVSSIFGQDIPESLANAYQEALRASLADEIRSGRCLIGVHRDDVQVLVDGRAAGECASQGQQRSVSLAMKLGLIPLYQERLNETPLILLDDVMSELDASRRQAVGALITGCQCILTGTEQYLMKDMNIDAVYIVKDGSLSRGSGLPR